MILGSEKLNGFINMKGIEQWTKMGINLISENTVLHLLVK